jgi:ATP-dependent protease HslVU (ClpYQ) peptidase subunit
MTTIVIYKGWMAADRRYSDGSSILTDQCPKILKREDGLTVAGAGDGAQSWAIMNAPGLLGFWTDSGPEFPLEWVQDKTIMRRIQLLMHNKGEKVCYLTGATRWCDPMPINKEMIAIGTGESFARAACKVLEQETDYPPKVIIQKSVEYAIQMDVNSGGDVDLVRL